MIEWMVMLRQPGKHLKGLGCHAFRESPRKGDYITMNDNEGQGQIYEVVAVIHPLDAESANTAGDIHLRALGSQIEWREQNID